VDKERFREHWDDACLVATVLSRITYRIVEGGLVIILFIVACYAGYWIVFGDTTNPRHVRMMALIPIVSEYWKAFLVLLIPLFFRTVRTFVEEVQEFAGAKRKSSLPGPGSEAKNPPTAPGQ
jgi:hypothetical protein